VYGESLDIQIVRNLLEAITLTRATYTHVWARNAEGGNAKQYIRQSAGESLVLGPWFIACVSIVSR